MDTSLQKTDVHSLRQAIDKVLYSVQKDSTSRRPTYPRVEAQVEKDLIPTMLTALGWDVRDSSHVLAKPEIR
jgi:predicted type IV restriction endonuclease